MREVFRERGVVAETKGQPAVPVSHPAVFGDDSMADSFLSAFIFWEEGYRNVTGKTIS